MKTFFKIVIAIVIINLIVVNVLVNTGKINLDDIIANATQ